MAFGRLKKGKLLAFWRDFVNSSGKEFTNRGTEGNFSATAGAESRNCIFQNEFIKI